MGHSLKESFLRVLRKEAVLPIFWTLTIVRPMSDEGGNGFSRIPILSSPPNLTRGNKELPDMKRATFSVLTLTVLTALVGCAHHRHLPASCVGGNCTVAPAGCCEATQPSCRPNCQPNGQACGDPCDDGAVPAKKHHCLLAGLCHKKPSEPAEQPAAEAGPPTGAITYPYYTTRGPRDFYAKNPGSIGP